MKYYKAARLDGWDFYTGKTINYRDDVTFADGFEIRHVGGLATLSHGLIEQYGRVQKAEAYA